MSSYIGASPPQVSGVVNRFRYIATSSQTAFTGADANTKTLFYKSGNHVFVFLNGVQLVEGVDFTKTSDTVLTLASGAATGDNLEILALGAISLNNSTQFKSQMLLGTAADLNVGTAATNILQLDGNAKIPAVDGSQLTNIGTTWESKSADFTAAAGRGYFCDTSSNDIDVTLPSGVIGDTIRFLDVAGTFDTNDLTILYGSSKIQGASANLDVTTERAGLALVYYNATHGWLLEDK